MPLKNKSSSTNGDASPLPEGEGPGVGSLESVGGQSFTLDSCIRYALTHSNDLRRGRIEQDVSRYEEKTAKLGFLPSVTGQVTGQYSWGRNIDPETNTYNTITTFNNYYSIGASVSVFDGGQTINAFRRVKNTRAQAATALQKAADDKAIAVMTKFVDAVYNQKSVALAEEKLADSRALLRKTQRMFELGEKSRPDVAQMESQVAEDDYNLLHQKNQARLTMLALKSEMNYESTETTDPTVPNDPTPSPSPSGRGEAIPDGSIVSEEDYLTLTLVPSGRGEAIPHVNNNIANNTDSLCNDLILTLDGINGDASPLPEGEGTGVGSPPSLLLASQKAEDLRYAYLISHGKLLPTLSLGGGVSTNFYRNLSLGGSVEPFGRQLHNNLGEYVYLSLSIPIFNPSSWRSAKRAKGEWKKAMLDLDDERRKWNDDYVQAVADRDGYRKETTQMERKVASDSLAYHLSMRKYEEGMLSTFDLHESAQTLLESRIKLLQTRLLYAMKQRLVRYYEGESLW